MKSHYLLRALVLAALAAFGAAPARAAGTIPLSLVQQFDANGDPLSGCLLYSYVAGTVATPQNSYADFALTQANANPVVCDASGRVPALWYQDGLIHVRLTDASGVVQLDTTMQVLGPSGGGGGGGGGGVDATSVASTGDIKARLSAEILSGWVILNGTTIGSATSGATQRANADTQNLFVYLWQNCIDLHCPVLGGRGGNAVADFSANKQIALPDMRAKTFAGRDCMGGGCAGLLLGTNITSGGTDGVDSAGASGGKANQTASSTIGQTNLPNVNFAVTIPAGQWVHGHTTTSGTFGGNSTFSTTLSTGGLGPLSFPTAAASIVLSAATLPALAGTANSGGNGSAVTSAPFANMPPFALVTFYQKL